MRRTASVDLGAEEFGIRTCKRVGLKLVGGMISSAADKGATVGWIREHARLAAFESGC